MNTLRLASLLLSSLALSFTAVATADDSAPPSTPPKESGKDKTRDGKGGDPVLRGPKVRDGETGNDESFGKSGQKQGKEGKPQRPLQRPREWFMTLKSLELPADQRAKIEVVVKEFETERNAFEKAHGEERRALEETLKQYQNADGQQAPDPNRSAKGPAKEARDKMKALMEKAPKVEGYQKRVFEILTPEQQETFKQRLAERQKEREGKEGARPGAPGRGKGAPGAPPKDGAKDGEMTDDGMQDDKPRGRQGKPGVPPGKPI